VEHGGTPSLRRGGVVGFIEHHRVEPADGVVLPEDNRVLVVEVVMVCGETGVYHRDLFRSWVVHLDLSGARALEREVLGELVHRPVFTERGLILGGANSSRHEYTSAAVHHHATGVGRPLPNLLVTPERRRWRIRVDLRSV